MSLEEADSEDARIEYIANITKLCLNVPADVWAEMLRNEDDHFIIKDFLDTPVVKLLLISVTSEGKLTVATQFPKSAPFPVKSMYYLKYQEITIPTSNFRDHIMRGTLSNLPLAQYQTIFEKVMVPLLCNPKNNVKWPSEVADDVVNHVQDFRNLLYYCVGQAKGRTMLPIPDGARNVVNLDMDSISSTSTSVESVKSVLDAIGTMVNNWTVLVNEVLEAKCEESVSDPLMYGPTTEIRYWNERRENIKFIFNQINDPIVKKMAEALERADSCYVQAYKKIMRDTSEALDEATDISCHLNGLGDDFKMLSECVFTEISSILPGILKAITLAWKESKYFRSCPSRIAVLVQKTCNLLIKRACDFLKGENLFAEPRKASQDNLIVVKNMVNVFVDSYYEHRKNMKSVFTHALLYPWEASDERVFKHFTEFNTRLQMIEVLFETVDTYHLILEFKLRGLYQTSLKLHLDGIFSEFCDNYKVFENTSYNPLDIENQEFEKDCKEFHKKSQHLESRMGAAISRGCIDCFTSEQAFVLVEELQPLIARPIVEKEFKNCMPHLICKVNHELIAARTMYEDLARSLSKKGYCFVYKNMPPLSSALRWALEVKEKISSPIKCLKNMEKFFVTPDDAKYEYGLYEELMEQITNFENDIFKKWAVGIEDTINSKLEMPILIKDAEDKFVVNYNLGLSETVEEVQALQKMGRSDIPNGALFLREKYDILHCSQSFMVSSAIWYNELEEDLMPFERTLIAEKWGIINDLFTKGLSMKWVDSGIQEYAETVYTITKEVYETMNTTKENINEVKDMIESWCSTPMYVRETPSSPIDLRIQMNDRVRYLYKVIKQTGLKMNEKMKENLKLFNCDPSSENWIEYLNYLERIIEDGLQDAAACSLKYLYDNTDAENIRLAPLIVVRLKLEEGFVFDPPLIHREAGSLLKCFEGATDKIIGVGAQIARMTDPEIDYERTLQKFDALSRLKTSILQHVVHSAGKGYQSVSQYRRFEDFWLAGINDMLEDFVLYGPITAGEESEEEEEEMEFGEETYYGEEVEFEEEEPVDEERPKELPPLELKAPTEEEFKAQIAQFETLYKRAEDFETTIKICSWLIIDTTSFKESLLSLIRQWISAYKQKLIEQRSLGKLRKVVKDDVE